MKTNCTDEEILFLATTIALELAKGKDEKQLHQLKLLLGQIYTSFCTICLNR